MKYLSRSGVLEPAFRVGPPIRAVVDGQLSHPNSLRICLIRGLPHWQSTVSIHHTTPATKATTSMLATMTRMS